jgi:hypothetical protein
MILPFRPRATPPYSGAEVHILSREPSGRETDFRNSLSNR